MCAESVKKVATASFFFGEVANVNKWEWFIIFCLHAFYKTDGKSYLKLVGVSCMHYGHHMYVCLYLVEWI